MKVNLEGVPDVICDVCRRSTSLDTGVQQFGSLQALWGPGSVHEGERYEVHLCEFCFFQALANLKQERRTQNLFSEDGHLLPDDLGLVTKVD
jgi:hypothetical protein